jgi:hypothetical protein
MAAKRTDTGIRRSSRCAISPSGSLRDVPLSV